MVIQAGTQWCSLSGRWQHESGTESRTLPGYGKAGYSEDCRSPEQGIRSVSVYKNRKFVGHRLLLPGSSAEKLLFEIAGVFLVAREKIKEAERKS